MNINFYYFILQISSKMSWIVIEVDVRFATKLLYIKWKYFLHYSVLIKIQIQKLRAMFCGICIQIFQYTTFLCSIDSQFVLFSIEKWNLFWLLVEIWKYLRLSVKLNIGIIPIGGNIFGEFIRFMFSPLMKVLNETVSIPKDF